MPLFSSQKKPIRGKLLIISSNNPESSNQQQRLLLEALMFAGYNATLVNFPLKTSLGSQSLEQFGSLPATTPHARAIFRALDRFEQKSHLEELLNEGKIVIATQYSITNAAFTGLDIADEHERVAFFRWVHNLEHKIFKMPKPDLNIVLQFPKQEQNSKIKKRTDEKQSPNNTNLYQEIAKLYPATKIVRGSLLGQLLTAEELHNVVWQLVRV